MNRKRTKSDEEKDFAIKLTSNTSGVTKVTNRLVVKTDQAAALRTH
jgi:osmotically-inducible protein OsmY